MKEEVIGLEVLSHKGVTWVNVEKPTLSDIAALAQRYQFHKLNLEDCLSKLQLTKIDEHEDHQFLVLHFPSLGNQSGVILSSQVSIFLGADYLVTVHQGDLNPLVEMFHACRNDERQRQALMGKGSSYLLYQIMHGLLDGIFPILDRVMRELDQIEDKVFDERVETVREVTLLRRRIADIRRIVFPLKGVTRDLALKAQRFSPEDISAFFSDLNDHVGKVWETLEECKETIDIYKDTDFMLNTEKTNRILAILTILFTLSIPATVAATFYGMNIHLPGGIQNGSWSFLGPYTTLIVIIISSIIPATLMLWFFRSRGWI